MEFVSNWRLLEYNKNHICFGIELQSICHIHTSCMPHGKVVDSLYFMKLFSYSEDYLLAPMVFPLHCFGLDCQRVSALLVGVPSSYILSAEKMAWSCVGLRCYTLVLISQSTNICTGLVYLNPQMLVYYSCKYSSV